MESHLLQMRGLKLSLNLTQDRSVASHLLQMRGLKPVTNKTIGIDKCRIFYRCVD